MNFMAENLEKAVELPAPAVRYLTQKAALGLAIFVIAMELVVLWQLFNPLEFFMVNATEQPRPEIQRVGLLKRF